MEKIHIFLLSTILASVKSEPCQSASIVSRGGDVSKYLMAETTTTVTFQAEPEGCDVVLRVLAVGGGGDGDAFSGNAGGSGHVEWSEVTVSSGEKVSLDIGTDGNFGSAGDSTVVSVVGSGQLLLGARAVDWM